MTGAAFSIKWTRLSALCFSCHAPGQVRYDRPRKKSRNWSGRGNTAWNNESPKPQCFFCDQAGHAKADCPERTFHQRKRPVSVEPSRRSDAASSVTSTEPCLCRVNQAACGTSERRGSPSGRGSLSLGVADEGSSALVYLEKSGTVERMATSSLLHV